MKEVFDFIKRTKVFHFATVDQEGRPHVRPFSGCILLDGQIHFFTTNYKKVYEQIQHNPWIELSSHDPMSHEWMRLSGRVVWDDDPRVWEANIPYGLYGKPSRVVQPTGIVEIRNVALNVRFGDAANLTLAEVRDQMIFGNQREAGVG